MNYVRNHAPGAGSIIQSVDLQSNALPLDTLFYSIFQPITAQYGTLYIFIDAFAPVAAEDGRAALLEEAPSTT